MRAGVQAVLFDLDGTLVDSAPDLAGAANELRERHQRPALPFEALRPMVGAGARGMLGVAFGVAPGDAAFDTLREDFLSLYEARMLRETRVFAAMEPVLQRLEGAGLRWGIVTNKHERFAWPVIQGLGLDRRAAALVAGDTTPHAKPHPAPLLEAARQAGVAPEACIYVGDDLRDIQAGRAAGMAALAAAWGYLGQGEAIEDWAADAVLSEPIDLLKWLELT
ncbi:phosphoglycolate phosphatase [Ideonella sp. 4Y16]|uniref:phosphoglycolate phosphatase n=1 Tax=Ideonella alba TaxID=2824118 RepID=A0A941BDC5_9BURK|nr:phosphoglycolate phosphatase [Ideonella alba]MBQ0932865.1 phosphoglycolate phosphatase [Ideonella alba]MBQ0945923.1 phosphoglycolate phosphatase [Ideonella alba]